MGKPWKELEKTAALAMEGTRINRAADYGISDVDVVLPDYPHLRVDCKYRTRHAFHAFVETIRSKYCKREGDVPVLVTKHHHSRREYVTVDLVFFASLLKLAKGASHNEDQHRTEAHSPDPEPR